MKIMYKCLLLLVFLPLSGRPQASLDSVIAAVKAANKSLIAHRLQMESEMRAARTGIYLPDPEVEFDYLWADPSESGNRTDFGITQSFSFPSLYFQKSNQSGLVRTGASLKYLQQEREVILLARSSWMQVVGMNKQVSLLEKRISMASEIAETAKLQLSRGEIDIIRSHRAQLELLNLKMERTELAIRRNTLLSDLTNLCGGKVIPVNDTLFPVMPEPSLNEIAGSFAGTLRVTSLENEIKVRQLDKSIAVSEWLPKFKAGYYSEIVTGLKYQGIQTGITIPLWQNSNSVSTAERQVKWAEAEMDHVKAEEKTRMTILLGKHGLLTDQIREIRSALLPVDGISLLRKALESGEINISEFYFEISVFYDAWMGLYKTETELAITEAEILYLGGK